MQVINQLTIGGIPLGPQDLKVISRRFPHTAEGPGPSGA